SILPFGDLIGDGEWKTKPPFPLAPTAHYTEFTAAWMSWFADRFGTLTSGPEDLHRDPVAVALAAAAQRTVEEAVRALHAGTVCLSGSPHVCLAGGVALNCVANGRLPDPVYVPPFPHDAGVAVGAAWSIQPPTRQSLLESPYLSTDLRVGPEPDLLRGAGFEV